MPLAVWPGFKTGGDFLSDEAGGNMVVPPLRIAALNSLVIFSVTDSKGHFTHEPRAVTTKL
jgi:hypothetical protein